MKHEASRKTLHLRVKRLLTNAKQATRSRDRTLKARSRRIGPVLLGDDIVTTALDVAEQGLDFADALHHAASIECDAMLTFDDRAFARHATKLRMKPAV